METLVIDRKALPEAINSFIDAERIRIERRADRVVLTPVTGETVPEAYGVNPDDYDTDADYLNAVPGMREKIIAGLNTPLSECEPIPEELYCV